jgi:hypothetical protein
MCDSDFRLTRLLVALLTFAAGASLAALFKLRPAHRTSSVPVGVETKISLPQTEAVAATQSTMKPFLTYISPDEIRRIVDINRGNGNQGEVLYLDSVLEPLGIERSESRGFNFTCRGKCEAAIFTLELDDEPGAETVLRLADSTGFYLHLVFKKLSRRRPDEAGWKFFGFIERYTWWNFDEPAPRTMTIGGKHYLRLHDLPGHGSGYGSEQETLYEVNEEGIKQVLDFQSGLYIGLGNPGIDSSIKVVATGYKAGTASIVLEAASTYTGSLKGLDCFPLFSTKRRVTFARRLGAQEFILDPSKSEMSAEEFDYLQDFWEDEAYLKEFVNYNRESLRKIATGRDERLKEWLRGFLNTCDGCSESEGLRKLLD